MSLYGNTRFEGWQVDFSKPGDYYSNLDGGTFNNDEASSMKVSAGFQVILYQHRPTFKEGGEKTTYGPGNYDRLDLNDQVTFLRIEHEGILFFP